MYALIFTMGGSKVGGIDLSKEILDVEEWVTEHVEAGNVIIIGQGAENCNYILKMGDP